MNCFCLRETFTSRSACRFWTHVTSYPMSLVCCWCRCRHCFLEPAIFCPMWGLTVSVSSGLCVASPSSNIMKVLGHWNYTPLLPSSLLEEKPQPCPTFHVQEGQPQSQPSRDRLRGSSSRSLWAKRQKPALWESSKPLGHWTFTPFSHLTRPWGEVMLFLGAEF